MTQIPPPGAKKLGLVIDLDLCVGCLVPVCDDGSAPVGAACFVGVDEPLRCE